MFVKGAHVRAAIDLFVNIENGMHFLGSSRQFVPIYKHCLTPSRWPRVHMLNVVELYSYIYLVFRYIQMLILVHFKENTDQLDGGTANAYGIWIWFIWHNVSVSFLLSSPKTSHIFWYDYIDRYQFNVCHKNCCTPSKSVDWLLGVYCSVVEYHFS